MYAFLLFFLACDVCAYVSLQIWAPKLGVWVWVRELQQQEMCSVTMYFTSPLSCNFCGKNMFFTQADLRRHLYLAHMVAQCRKIGCHRLLHDTFSRNVHENMQHPDMTSGCEECGFVYACLCVLLFCVCACMLFLCHKPLEMTTFDNY